MLELSLFLPSHLQAQSRPLALSSSQNVSQQVFTWEDYKDPAMAGEHRSLIGTVFSFVWKLVVVIGLIYLTLRFLKLLYANKISATAGGSVFSLLDSFYLKPNQALHLVEIVDRYFVMAGTAQSLTVVCEITDKEKIEQFKSTSNGRFNFKDNLSDRMNGKSLTLEDRIALGSQKILEQINKISGK